MLARIVVDLVRFGVAQAVLAVACDNANVGIVTAVLHKATVARIGDLGLETLRDGEEAILGVEA